MKLGQIIKELWKFVVSKFFMKHFPKHEIDESSNLVNVDDVTISAKFQNCITSLFLVQLS